MFIAKDYEVSIFVKIHNYFAGLFSRKDTLRTFCTRNGIDYKPDKNQRYQLPNSFLIEHEELKKLSGIRDKVILTLYDDYNDAQLGNLDSQARTKSEIEKQISIIESDKKYLEKQRALLKKEKIPVNILGLNSRIESIKTKIRNENTRKAEQEVELKKLINENVTNRENWLKQIEIIDNIFEIQKKVIEKNISKHIRKYLNFTDFNSNLDDYGDNIKKVLKGEINEN